VFYLNRAISFPWNWWGSGDSMKYDLSRRVWTGDIVDTRSDAALTLQGGC